MLEFIVYCAHSNTLTVLIWWNTEIGHHTHFTGWTWFTGVDRSKIPFPSVSSESWVGGEAPQGSLFRPYVSVIVFLLCGKQILPTAEIKFGSTLPLDGNKKTGCVVEVAITCWTMETFIETINHWSPGYITLYVTWGILVRIMLMYYSWVIIRTWRRVMVWHQTLFRDRCNISCRSHGAGG